MKTLGIAAAPSLTTPSLGSPVIGYGTATKIAALNVVDFLMQTFAAAVAGGFTAVHLLLSPIWNAAKPRAWWIQAQSHAKISFLCARALAETPVTLALPHRVKPLYQRVGLYSEEKRYLFPILALMTTACLASYALNTPFNKAPAVLLNVAAPPNTSFYVAIPVSLLALFLVFRCAPRTQLKVELASATKHAEPVVDLRSKPLPTAAPLSATEHVERVTELPHVPLPAAAQDQDAVISGESALVIERVEPVAELTSKLLPAAAPASATEHVERVAEPTVEKDRSLVGAHPIPIVSAPTSLVTAAQPEIIHPVTAHPKAKSAAKKPPRDTRPGNPNFIGTMGKREMLDLSTPEGRAAAMKRIREQQLAVS